MATNRRQRERVALALTAPGRLHTATPDLIVDLMIADDCVEVRHLLRGALGGQATERAVADACKAAGIVYSEPTPNP